MQEIKIYKRGLFNIYLCKISNAATMKRRLSMSATRKSAFTLSEVLVTLVIIGIIAAITVPTLMANYRKQEVSSRLKKFYSTLSNAVRLADMENPSFLHSTYETRRENYGQWWNDNLGKYMPVTEKDNTDYKVFSASDSNGYTPSKLYLLNDGTMFYAGSSNYLSDCRNATNFLIDINGEKKPNQKGKDIFAFSIGDRYGYSYDFHFISNGIFVCAHWGFCGLSYRRDVPRDSELRECADGGAEECTRLIQLDGWQIRDDYPLL
ncbi:MAG: type II secretion system GspH family protein [Candidatus Gastranaerophilales bacterium]|nr:type II secretion system GspH family protein [Candidatus Gastranaerophilales bacterium]